MSELPTIVTWHDGRDVYVYSNGDRFYVDEVRAMLAGAEERRKQPLKVDDLDELRARIDRLQAAREKYAGPPISRHVAGLLGIPLDDPDVLPDDGDCRHGCNGDCVHSGGERCNFTCHDLDAQH